MVVAHRRPVMVDYFVLGGRRWCWFMAVVSVKSTQVVAANLVVKSVNKAVRLYSLA